MIRRTGAAPGQKTWIGNVAVIGVVGKGDLPAGKALISAIFGSLVMILRHSRGTEDCRPGRRTAMRSGLRKRLQATTNTPRLIAEISKTANARRGHQPAIRRSKRFGVP